MWWCNGYEERPTQTFAIIHVADTFVQSDLEWTKSDLNAAELKL